jgi:hypothetical protein
MKGIQLLFLNTRITALKTLQQVQDQETMTDYQKNKERCLKDQDHEACFILTTTEQSYQKIFL